MPSPSLIQAFEAAQERHTAAVADLVPLLIEMALATVAEVLPGATVLETEGEMNEDWIFTLPIPRVLDREGGVLYAIDAGHDDPEWPADAAWGTLTNECGLRAIYTDIDEIEPHPM